MGFTTDFVGYVSVEPALNLGECEYLTAFTKSRRWFRPEGPYVALDNPFVAETYDDLDRFNRPWPGEPSLWCMWTPCLDGTQLSFDGIEKAYQPVEWMRYLITHFLKPNATAAKTKLPCFDDFTFDHVLSGVIVGCRRDTGRLFAIEVRANRVRERELMPGVPESALWGELPYQALIDDAVPSRRMSRIPKGEDV